MNESRGLFRGVHIQSSRIDAGLVGNNSNRPSFKAGEANNDGRREQGLNLKEFPVIDKRFNDLDHVVVLLGGFRNQGCDLVCAFFGAIVFEEVARRLLIAVLRQVGQQSTCVI